MKEAKVVIGQWRHHYNSVRPHCDIVRPCRGGKCDWYDCGDKVGFLQSNIAVDLSRPDIAPAPRAMLAGT